MKEVNEKEKCCVWLYNLINELRFLWQTEDFSREAVKEIVNKYDKEWEDFAEDEGK